MTERDLDALQRMLHPEFRFRSLIARMSAVYVGLPGLERYFDDIEGSFEAARWRFVDVVAHRGDTAVVRVRFRATGCGSGIDIDDVNACVWEFRDGLGDRNDVYMTLDEAFGAAGLAA